MKTTSAVPKVLFLKTTDLYTLYLFLSMQTTKKLSTSDKK